MDFEPLLAAPLAVQIHAAAVTPAFVLGAWQILLSRKGQRAHRTAGSALFVHQVNPDGPFGFSWIHLFVPVTLLGVVGALYGAWTHNIRLHKNSMIGTYIGGLMIAGAFAFAPGRIMNGVVFG
jgi:uncharacterized membrane protein